MVVITKRQPLNVVINGASDIVRSPLSDRGHVTFKIGTDRVDDRDHAHGDDRKIQDGVLVSVEEGVRRCSQPTGHSVSCEHVIQNDLKWPRLQHIRDGNSQYGEQCNRHSFPVWNEQTKTD
jgi:hypothetical protein